MTSKSPWKFTQVFGDKVALDNVNEEDIITELKFDKTGDYIALGDTAGRIIMFEKNFAKKHKRGYHEFSYLTEFQSHIKDFDCLKSDDIEERINCIEWLRPEGPNMFALSTNDKTIKLWKISNKIIKRSERFSEKYALDEDKMRLPKLKLVDQGFCPSLKRTFPHLHQMYIHSVSVSSNQENFLSADEIGVHLWNIEATDKCYNLIEIKSDNMNNITKLITAARFHPVQDSIFGFATSEGVINVGDLRINSKVENHLTELNNMVTVTKKNFFTDIVSSISDVKFTGDGRQVMSRDFLTVKIWDLAKTDKPVESINLFEPIKSKLCEIYEKDYIFEKFTVSPSPDGNGFVTGMFDNKFHLYDRKEEKNTQFELNFDQKSTHKNIPKDYFEPLTGKYDYNQRALKTDWNPKSNCVAVACLNCLFFYNA